MQRTDNKIEIHEKFVNLDLKNTLNNETDNVVMIVKITSSLIDSITKDKIYRIFNDVENDERYIIDELNRKVLFDRTIFKYEIF